MNDETVWLRRALLCGGLPLALGFAIVLAYDLTQAHILVGAGLVLIVCSMPVFFFGTFCLLKYRTLSVKTKLEEKYWRPRYLIAGSLLLANFSSCGVSVAMGSAIHSRIEVTIENTGTAPLSEIRLIAEGIDEVVRPLPPGAVRTVHVWAQGDGHLSLAVSDGTQTNQQVIIGYITSGMGDRVHVKIDESLRITSIP